MADSTEKQSKSASQRRSFTTSEIPNFLNSGWILSIRNSNNDVQNRNQDQILIGWGAGSWSSRPLMDEKSQRFACSLYAPDFHLTTSQPWWNTPHWDLLDRDRFASLVFAGVENNVNAEDQGFQWVEPSPERFKQFWDEIFLGMRLRGVKKAVPVVFSQATRKLSAQDRLKILVQMLKLPQNLFLYGLWGQGQEQKQKAGSEFGMLGATPELLFRCDDGESLSTVALAGTRAKEPNAASMLLSDPKERHEHQLVIDDIQAVLANLGQVSLAHTEVVELPTLVHLKTEISASLDQPIEFETLAHALHPTPALGVSPRELGSSEIRRWEESDLRGRFGAPFGVVFEDDQETGSQHQHCVVAIRNIQWQDDQVVLGSGCGVVEQSQFEKEWRELSLKRDSVKRMLGL